MAKYEFSHDQLNGLVEDVRNRQYELVRNILYDNGRTMGGLIGSITGANGHYDLESIFLDENCKYVEPDDEENNTIPIVCHLNYPAFEIDVNFYWLSVDERQQIVELLIKKTQEL